MVAVVQADLAPALSDGFPQATAEKVHRLLGILRELQSNNETADRFTLKGGTALNVFHPSRIPRLSVDLDLMATGFPEATPRSVGQERLVSEVENLVGRLGYRSTRHSTPTACTLNLAYQNSLGGQDQIKLELDLLNRMTLLPPWSS